MDLHAINSENAGTWRLTRLGMAACFIAASVVLLGQLTMARPTAATSNEPAVNSGIAAPTR